MKTISLLCVLAVAGCGKGESTPKTDWSDSKRNTETLSVDGITYTIEIPEGLPKSEHDPYSWSGNGDVDNGVPRVITRVSPHEMPISEQTAMAETTVNPATAQFVRKEQRPDGWALTVVDSAKTSIGVVRFTQIGGKTFKCAAAQLAKGELPSFDKTRAMLEAICDSMKGK